MAMREAVKHHRHAGDELSVQIAQGVEAALTLDTVISIQAMEVMG